MKRKLNSIILIILIAIILAGCASGVTQAPQVYRVFLPAVSKSPPVLLGAQIEGAPSGREQYLVDGSAVLFQLKWQDVETSPGVYTWPAWMDTAAAAVAGHPLAIGFRGVVPAWARRDGALACEAPQMQYVINYAQFVRAAVERYRPTWAEIWNEPDAQHGSASLEQYFGCISNPLDYVAILAAVDAELSGMPVIILGGALMIDRQPLSWWEQAAAGINAHADGLSFHRYESCGRWGLGVLSRADYLRQASDLPLYLTETSVLYDVASAECEQQQAEYLAALYPALVADGRFRMVLWYSLANNNWRNSDLVLRDIKKAAWFEYQRLFGGDEPR